MTLEGSAVLVLTVGAVGVVLAILYLAAQIRQNTQAVRLATVQSSTESHSHYLGAVAQNENLARILRSAQSTTSNLTDDERFRLRMLLLQVFNHLESDFYLRQDGVLPAPLAERFSETLATWLKQPGVMEWWSVHKALMSRDFVAWVEAEVIGKGRA